MRTLESSESTSGSQSAVPRCRTPDISCADALQREAVPDSLVNDPSQLLSQCDPCVPRRKRRKFGQRFRNVAGAGAELLRRDDLVN